MSSVSVELISGPSVSTMARQGAEEGLRKHAAVQAGAPYALEQVEGRWVAAIVHEASPPFGGPPAGPPDEGGGPPPPSPDEGGDTPPESGDESGPPSDDGGEEKKDKGDKKGDQIHKVLDLLNSIAQALGIPLDPAGGDLGGDPGLGPDAGGMPPPGPPAGPPGGPPLPEDHSQTIKHMKALKPGEVPPGGTAAGAPAFSSVQPDHPWADALGKVASFHVSSPIGDASLAEVEAELQSMASQVDHRVSRFAEGRDEEGNRLATAVITAH